MDLSRPISYRGLQLNDAGIASTRENIAGIAIERVSYGQVPGFGYIEKRSNADGYDAGDVFLGKRDISLSGTIYGKTRADLFDRKSLLSAALSPTGAYAESPPDYGYLPLTFEEPTLDTITWETGIIKKMMRVRPRTMPSFSIVRDAIGGVEEYGLAIPWEVDVEARDPRIYYQTSVGDYFDAAGATANGTLVLDNRGDYPAPIRIELYAAAGAGAVKMVLLGLGTSMTLEIPASAVESILRYDGHEKYVTLEENGLEVLRMDLITFGQDTTHPQVPPGTGHQLAWTHTDDVDVAKNVDARSLVLYWEAWA